MVSTLSACNELLLEVTDMNSEYETDENQGHVDIVEDSG